MISSCTKELNDKVFQDRRYLRLQNVVYNIFVLSSIIIHIFIFFVNIFLKDTFMTDIDTELFQFITRFIVQNLSINGENCIFHEYFVLVRLY